MKENVEDENSKNINSLYQNYKVSFSCNFQFRRLLNTCSASLDWKIAVCGLPCLRAARLPTTMDFIARSWVSLVVNMGAFRQNRLLDQ